MKKTLIAIGIVFLLLVAVLLINTFTFESRQIITEKGETLAIDAPGALERFRQSITYPTISHENPAEFDSATFQAFNEFLLASFPAVYENLELKRINEFGLLFSWKGSNPSLAPGLLMGHYDVVPVEQNSLAEWKAAPFDGAMAGNSIVGRGTIDDKNNVMAILEAVSFLLNQDFVPERPLYLAFGHDEEVGGEFGAQAMAAYLEEQGVSLDYVLDEGGIIKKDGITGFENPIALIGIAEKGYVSLRLTVNAPGGHSSMPEKETSINILANALHKLSNNPFPSKLKGAPSIMFDYLGPEMGFGQRMVFANLWLLRPILENIMSKSASSNATIRTTMVPTIFHAGVKDNVIPTEASVVINFRIIPGETIESVQQYVQNILADERITIAIEKNFGVNPSKVSDLESAVFEKLNKSIKRYYPEAVVSPYIVVGATDSRHFGGLSDNVFRFSPVLLDNAGLKTMHGINEQIEKEVYLKSISFYADWIKSSTTGE